MTAFGLHVAEAMGASDTPPVTEWRNEDARMNLRAMKFSKVYPSTFKKQSEKGRSKRKLIKSYAG